MERLYKKEKQILLEFDQIVRGKNVVPRARHEAIGGRGGGAYQVRKGETDTHPSVSSHIRVRTYV